MIPCPYCDRPMIYGGDHDGENADGVDILTSNHSCNHCNCYVEVTIPADFTVGGHMPNES